jgi:hypothetical protein
LSAAGSELADWWDVAWKYTAQPKDWIWEKKEKVSLIDLLNITD